MQKEDTLSKPMASLEAEIRRLSGCLLLIAGAEGSKMETDQKHTTDRRGAIFDEWHLNRPLAYCAMIKEMLRRLFDFAWDAALKEVPMPTETTMEVAAGEVVTTARDAIAHCLLMGMGTYLTPEEFADGILKRLQHEGFVIIRRDERDKLQHDLDEAVGYKLAVAQETRGDHGYEEG